MSRFRAHLPRRLFLIVMFAGSAFITASSLGYFDFETFPPFVVERMPEHFAALWLGSLRVHVATALLTLPLCLLLTTRWIQRHVAWHRWLGRVSGVLVLAALVPSGAVLAFHAKGGAVVTAGFLLSAAIIAWFMVRGVGAARRRDLVSHRRAMLHVVGQMSVAVTSRTMLFGFDAAGIDPDIAYVIALWGPVLASAGVVEILCARSNASRAWFVSVFVSLAERIRRDRLPQNRLVRTRSFIRPVARSGR
jgi:hypothetical protein